MEGEREEEEDDEGGDEEDLDKAVGQVNSSGPRPFILPLIWIVNDFYPIMSP